MLIESPSEAFNSDLRMLHLRLYLADSAFNRALSGEGGDLERERERVDREQVQPAVEYWVANGEWEIDPRPWMHTGRPWPPHN